MKTPNRLSPGVRLLLHGGLLLLAFGVAGLCGPAAALITIGIFTAPVYFYLGWIESRGPLPITPLSFHFFWYAVAFGVASIHYGFVVLRGEPIELGPISLHAESVQWALVFSLLASFMLHVGLRFVKPKRILNPDGRPLSTISVLVLFILGLIVLSLASILPGENKIANLGALAGFLLFLPYAILLALALRPNVSRLMPKMIAGTAFTVLAAAFASSKGYIMLALFPLGIVLWRRSKRLAIPYGLGAALLYLLVVAPLVTYYRATMYYRLQADYETPGISKQWDGFMKRVFEVEPVAYIVHDAQANGLKYGSTMGSIIWGLIPRAFWPDKPSTALGPWFSVYVGLAQSEETANTSTAMGAPGELYWNLGVLGIILGMPLIGLLYGGLWKISVEQFGLTSIRGTLLYLIACFNMVGTPDASSLFLSAVVLYCFVFGLSVLKRVPIPHIRLGLSLREGIIAAPQPWRTLYRR